MAELKILQDGQISGVRETADGYLAASVLCARTGIQDYAGFEVGRPDMQRVRVYRPETSVFATDSLRSYAGKPATNDHPAQPVTADNWKEFAVGSIGNEVMRDGEYVRVPLVLMDKAAIDEVKDGKRELSMGYSMSLDFKDGVTPEGEAYDAIMTDLKMNHIAVVSQGRAGSKARIGDSWGASPLTTKDGDIMSVKTQTVVVDGLSIETTDQGAQALAKLQATIERVSDSAEVARLAHDSAIAEKDKALAAKDSKIAELEGKVLDGASLDALVAKRSALVTKAQSIAKDADFAGKSDIEIKKITVDSARGADFTDDKSEAYIDAAFDMLEAPKGDTVRDALKNRDTNQSVSDNGQAGYEQRLNDAWKEAK